MGFLAKNAQIFPPAPSTTPYMFSSPFFNGIEQLYSWTDVPYFRDVWNPPSPLTPPKTIARNRKNQVCFLRYSWARGLVFPDRIVHWGLPFVQRKNWNTSTRPKGSKLTPSISKSARFIFSPPWKPPNVLSVRIARWQGNTIGNGFLANALPTALALVGAFMNWAILW